MYNIRPVSDLRNKLSEIESTVKKGESVFLTKNGYGSMVVISIEKYAELTDEIERKLDEADALAKMTDKRYSLDETYREARTLLNE
ncbi:MAG: type II toxin-antitoxin system prevent-host-death family antitoxin [Clostridiales Family XIII bacterium]|jgi:prevent-host-death family protein|nr:type II toxin-antitoxin system prevent-host-death family antitoxin [Clostridiales Family XIII bacterium]